MTTTWSVLTVGLVTVTLALIVPPTPAAAAPSPGALCGPGDRPESALQGQTTLTDMASGRSQDSYSCGVRIVGRHDMFNRGSNWQLARVGHCAYVSTMNGVTAVRPEPNDPATTRPPAGVAVLDVREPTRPLLTTILRTAGSVDSAETMDAVDAGRRKVLVAGSFGGDTRWGLFTDRLVGAAMDVYDVSQDCGQPQLRATVYWPENAHDVTISPDGRYVFGTGHTQSDKNPSVMVMDISDLSRPRLVLNRPLPLPDGTSTACHTVEFNASGTRMYCAGVLSAAAEPDGRRTLFWQRNGPTIWDVSDFKRGLRNAEFRFVGESAVGNQGGHHAVPATIKGKPYLIAANELDLGDCEQSAFPRIWDISNERQPQVMGEFRLEVQDHCDDPAVAVESALGNYGTHYNSVDNLTDTKLGLFSSTAAGIRIVDLRNPRRPREVAYYKPGAEPDTALQPAGAHASAIWHNANVTDACGSRNVLVPETGHIWFVCQANGFFVAEMSPAVRAHLDMKAGLTTPGAGALPNSETSAVAPSLLESMASAEAVGKVRADGARPIPLSPLAGSSLLLIGSVAVVRRRSRGRP
jgi:hypothetical protein